MPEYESDRTRVTLRVFDGSYDERMSLLVAKWRDEGRDADLDSLLVLTYLRQHAYIDTASAADLLQLPRDEARAVLDQLSYTDSGFLERRGRTKAVTYYLNKAVAKDLLGKAAYTRSKGVDPLRYKELVRQYVIDHGHITPAECRELLGLGGSPSARVETSRYLKDWAGEDGFLYREGRTSNIRYLLRTEGRPGDEGPQT